ncbi:histidine--tRNA ligase [Candidatus Woesearchaeota archaeon]|jgi:histidyl-tRNA synthetase|nr:histidine--tRNA ligase [Candidatus Woesearchaeota archaeon]MBT4110545.1 histidine--tRNA ligase [Candidatus Woesearchaeota archaeon]MBT4335931.1 histidine--tRNA ligase [Candidatus Woesearchaeota archaeon]MBT6744591.1 histidine--tRNA ligase [Candidatus Woesearchaeota archaeon]
MKMKLQTARGVQDTPPEEKIIKNKVVDTLREVFQLYGFAPLETPIIERYETLTAKFAAGEASDALKETFTLTDQGKRDLGLRFDLTVPLARFVAMNPTLKMPFKRFEMGSVFRDGPIKAGRVRQFWQCDVDTIGSKSMLADAEIIAIMSTGFNKLKLDTIIKVNNRKLLNGILEQAGIENKEEAIISIDKLAKIRVTGVTEELLEKGFKKKQINAIFELIQENISLAGIKKKITSEEGKEGVKELEEVFSYLRSMGIKSAKFDVSLARGLAYYTGTIFEAFMKKGKITSSLAAGGRWDNMIGNFMGGNRVVPAVGGSFGLVPIIESIKEKENLVKRTLAKVFVIPIKTEKESLQIVQQLRNEGIAADYDLNGRGMSKNLQYANTLGIPYAIIIGSDEVKKNKVLLRDMVTGDQKLLALKSVVKKLKQDG